MTATANIAAYLDDLLGTGDIPDYPNALNGLQIENQGTVTRIGAAVDFSMRIVREAADANVDLLLVHHGMFWGGLQQIRGVAYARLHTLMEQGIAVYSAHLPLDCHPLYGNNALLAAELGLDPTGEFAKFRTIYVGVSGTSDVDTRELAERADAFAKEHGGSARCTPIVHGRRTRAWGICTGGGASSDTLREARERGLDTLIVGEGPHHTAVEADDSGIAVIYAGHYATETLGVRALAAHLSDRFGMPWVFLEAPTGL